MYLTIFIGAAAVVIFFIIISIMSGKLSFWRLAAKKPDEVFRMIYDNHEVWVVDNGSPDTWKGINKEEYSGPFRLYVPALNQVVIIYGKADRIEQEQERIMEVLLPKDS